MVNNNTISSLTPLKNRRNIKVQLSQIDPRVMRNKSHLIEPFTPEEEKGQREDGYPEISSPTKMPEQSSPSLRHKYPQSWVRNPNVVMSQQVPKDSSDKYQASSQIKDYYG